MADRPSDQEHRALRELLGGFALGALDPSEHDAVAAHLATCPSCQAEIQRLLVAVAALPLSVEEREPPPGLRDAILASVDRKHPAPAPVTSLPSAPSASRASLPAWLGWAAAAVLLVATLGMLIWNLSLRDGADTRAATIALEASRSDLEAAGAAEYLRDDGIIRLTFDQLPPIGDDQVYQVWLIDDAGPRSAGVLGAGQRSFAVAADPTAYHLLAVTIEPGPIGQPAPTDEPFLVAELAGFDA